MEQENYVSFEVAKLLKEKGYDILSEFSYKGEKDFKRGIYKIMNSRIPSDDFCAAPLLYEARKWLIDKYNLFVSVIYNSHDDGHFAYRIYKIGTDDTYSGEYYKNKYSTYEEALNEGIKEALKMI